MAQAGRSQCGFDEQICLVSCRQWCRYLCWTDGGVFLSTNNGTSWTQVNTGLPSTSVRSLAVSGANLFAGTYERGVWKRPVSEMTTLVQNAIAMPTSFSLEPNYPIHSTHDHDSVRSRFLHERQDRDP